MTEPTAEFDQPAPAELGPLEKPYTYLPEYADVAYVDGKLRVAQGILSRTTDPEKRQRWQQTVDILLGQRSALTAVCAVLHRDAERRFCDYVDGPSQARCHKEPGHEGPHNGWAHYPGQIVSWGPDVAVPPGETNG